MIDADSSEFLLKGVKRNSMLFKNSYKQEKNFEIYAIEY